MIARRSGIEQARTRPEIAISGLLLDTHYTYALAGAPGRLSPAAQVFLAHPPGRLVVSAVSIWEMRLKWHALYLSSGGRK